MLALSIIATILLAINIFFTLTLIEMVERRKLSIAIIYDIFALVTIWILYSY